MGELLGDRFNMSCAHLNEKRSLNLLRECEVV
jgi:hypothetical protein